jgi:hypothetical protein
MNDVFVAFKAQLCSEIVALVAEMKRLRIDNRHEGVRHANSLKKHLGTTEVMNASYDALIAFKEHLIRKFEDEQYDALIAFREHLKARYESGKGIS